MDKKQRVERQSITLYCDNDLYAKAKAVAKADGRSICNFVRRAVAEAVRKRGAENAPATA